MKKHGKRIIAALLSVLMIVTTMAPNAMHRSLFCVQKNLVSITDFYQDSSIFV